MLKIHFDKIMKKIDSNVFKRNFVEQGKLILALTFTNFDTKIDNNVKIFVNHTFETTYVK